MNTKEAISKCKSIIHSKLLLHMPKNDLSEYQEAIQTLIDHTEESTEKPSKVLSEDEIYTKLQGLLYYFIDEMAGEKGEKELRIVATKIYKSLKSNYKEQR